MLEDFGQMQVSKILYGAAKPYDTTVRATGIAEADWQTFYDISEQVPTAVRISSDVSDEHAHCCGITVQKMPDSAPHGDFYELDDLRFEELPLLASSMKDNNDLLAYLNELIPNAELTEKNCKKIPLDFFCRCSKKGFANRLKELGATELDHVIQDSAEKGVDLTCHFCNEVYQFPLDELKSIASEISTTGSSA